MLSQILTPCVLGILFYPPLCLSDQGMVCLAIACIDARSNPLYVALFIATSTRGEKRMLANDDHYPPPLMFTFEKDLECSLWEEIQGPRIDAAPNV